MMMRRQIRITPFGEPRTSPHARDCSAQCSCQFFILDTSGILDVKEAQLLCIIEQHQNHSDDNNKLGENIITISDGFNRQALKNEMKMHLKQ
jgi:hypothetical protein